MTASEFDHREDASSLRPSPPGAANSHDPRAPYGPLWYGDQNRDGVDLSLIRANLRLSVDERIAKGERARDIVKQLRRETEHQRRHG